MGVFIPVIFLVAAYVATAAAVIQAVVAATLIYIALAVVAVVATGMATYYFAVGDIQNSMLFSGIAIGAGVGSVYLAYAAKAATVNTLLAEGTAAAITASQATATSYAYVVGTYVQVIYASWQELAGLLHLDILGSIHQIAYLLSEDYRKVMNDVFYQVSKVSESIGWGPMTLNLLFENSRTLILNSSSALGEGYDIGQVKWLNTFNQFLHEFSRGTDHYKSHPADLIDWIANNTYRPALDAQATSTRSLYQGIASALGLIKSGAESLTRFKNDVDRLVGDLPEVIRNQIQPQLNGIIKTYDDFIRLNYTPTIKLIDGTLTILGVDMTEQKKKAADLVARLSRPGHYLKEIDSLDTVLAREDEDMVNDLAGREQIRELNQISKTITGFYDDMIEDIERWEKRPISEAPGFLRLERPTEVPTEAMEKRTSPFVGDY